MTNLPPDTPPDFGPDDDPNHDTQDGRWIGVLFIIICIIIAYGTWEFLGWGIKWLLR